MEIDWKKDYQGEFSCPKCQAEGLYIRRIHKSNNEVEWKCSTCNKTTQSSCKINIFRVADPLNPEVFWYFGHRYKEFICPECKARDIYLNFIEKRGIGSKGKKCFVCKSCGKRQVASNIISRSNISQFSNNHFPVKPFDFNDDQWDLRAINPNFDLQNINNSTVNFTLIGSNWLKKEVKNYSQHLCKIGNNCSTVINHVRYLRMFSDYLQQKDIVGFHQINRSLISDYLAQIKKMDRRKVGVLKSFFTIGTLLGWFSIDQDIIRNDDYPKAFKSNPDPLSNQVQKQIEQNLHKLPDPIARMWIICFFAAMRPSELALLKKDCLVQEGQQWKLVWHRKKTNDEHEVPISRTIAKVVQALTSGHDVLVEQFKLQADQLDKIILSLQEVA